jgi:hypothetical protein
MTPGKSPADSPSCSPEVPPWAHSPGRGAGEKTPRRRRGEARTKPTPGRPCGRPKPVDPAGPDRYRGRAKPCESRARGRPGAAHGSVTRAQPTLGRGTPPGNWGQSPIGEGRWKAPSPKGRRPIRRRPPEDGGTAHQVVGGLKARQAEDG